MTQCVIFSIIGLGTLGCQGPLLLTMALFSCKADITKRGTGAEQYIVSWRPLFFNKTVGPLVAGVFAQAGGSMVHYC